MSQTVKKSMQHQSLSSFDGFKVTFFVAHCADFITKIQFKTRR